MKTKVYHISFHEFGSLAHLFFWGCNFSCKGCLCKAFPFDCHLPTSQAGIKIKEGDLQFLDVEDIVRLLEPIKPKVALFGGWEPTLDPVLHEIAPALRSKLETYNYLLTNGYDISISAIKEMDEVKVSIKAYTDDIHRYYTGKSNKRVLENFKRIYEEGIKLSAETVLIPGCVDIEEIGRIAAFISSIDKNIPLRIDAYWPVACKDWRAPTREEVMRAAKEARKYLNNVSFLAGDESIEGKIIRVF
ncbi:MAG: radical SAM protein [Candidatus Methanospirareceae archaeon]